MNGGIQLPEWVAIFELALLAVAVLWGLLWSYSASETNSCAADWVITGWAGLYFIYRLTLFILLL